MTEALVHEPSDDNLANIVEEISQKLVSGNSDAIEAILAKHPNEADRLRALLPTLRVLVEIGSSPVGQNRSNGTVAETYSQEPLHQQILGDFCILREIGRGGMGVVFEAEQVSLRRRVALKVLPAASMLDPRSLQRFRNEAQAAASLHHRNIVPIYGVGCERGVHYYAMQYIDGLTIAEVIAKLRESSKLALDPQVQPQPHTAEVGSQAQLNSKEKQAAETEVMAALSTEKSSNSGAWFRRLAEHMAQVVDALHHAHELGVTHRDIKPANLMLDRLGRIWVTDFGLARVEGADNLTMTGDLLGTLRYMSPEQALAKRLGVDHRSDIYSLGITLYELLTLKPAFAGAGRQELMQQLANDEPKSLREQNPAIPRDLETIVIKATQKNPTERYQTAAELAADLRRFIDDRHIVARRPSLPVRAMRLAKRHRGLVSTVCVMLLLVTIGCLGWASDYRQRVASTTRLVNEALEELAIRRATAIAKQDDFVAWEQALSVAERAVDFTENGPIDVALRSRALGLQSQLTEETRTAHERKASRENDARLLESLSEARMKLLSDPYKTGSYPLEFVLNYAQALSEYGLDLVKLDRTSIEERIRASAIRTDLVYALTALAIVSRRDTNEAKALPDRHELLSIAVATAPSMPPIQKTLVVVLQSQDTDKLRKLVENEDLDSLPANAVFCMANALVECGEKPLALSTIRSYLAANPSDYVLNAMLGALLIPRLIQLSNVGNLVSNTETSFESSEAIRYLTAAIALRPNSAHSLHNLGSALNSHGRIEESKTAYLKAIELNHDFAPPRLALAFILAQQGKHDEALGEIREAIRIAPRYPYSYHGLGILLRRYGRLEEAEAANREAIRLKPNAWFQRKTLVEVLRDQNKFDQAIAECHEAICLDPMQIDLHVELGNCFIGQKRYDAAIDSFQAAIRLNSKDFTAHCGLGIAFLGQRKYAEAGDALAKAVALYPNHPQAHQVLGRMFLEMGKLTEAIREFQEDIRINPKRAPSYGGLGQALSLQGRFDESFDAMQEAARIEPNSPMRLDNLGIALSKKGELDAALNAHRAAISLDPNFAPAHRNLASMFLSVGKLEEAEVSCREGIRLHPQDAEAHFILGCVLDHRRDFIQAEKAYREALLHNPNHARAMYNAACAALQAVASKQKEADQTADADLERLPHQALVWLQADVDAFKKLAESAPPGLLPQFINKLTHWDKDPDLESLRDEEQVKKLLAEDQELCKKLWSDHAELLKQLREKQSTIGK